MKLYLLTKPDQFSKDAIILGFPNEYRWPAYKQLINLDHINPQNFLEFVSNFNKKDDYYNKFIEFEQISSILTYQKIFSKNIDGICIGKDMLANTLKA